MAPPHWSLRMAIARQKSGATPALFRDSRVNVFLCQPRRALPHRATRTSSGCRKEPLGGLVVERTEREQKLFAWWGERTRERSACARVVAREYACPHHIDLGIRPARRVCAPGSDSARIPKWKSGVARPPGSARRWRAVFGGSPKISFPKLSRSGMGRKMCDEGLGEPPNPARGPRPLPIPIAEFEFTVSRPAFSNPFF